VQARTIGFIDSIKPRQSPVISWDQGNIPTYGVAWGWQGGGQGSLHQPKARPMTGSTISGAVLELSRMSRSLSSGAHSRDPLAHPGYSLG